MSEYEIENKLKKVKVNAHRVSHLDTNSFLSHVES